MNNNELSRNADFLQIAIEEMESGSYETAQEFVEDVYKNIVEELE